MMPLLLAGGVSAQEAGWQYSPLPGEGDRAAMGCAEGSTAADHACLVVRCEDDFSVGIHVHTGRHPDDTGLWDMTLDREDRRFEAVASPAPYGARIAADADWLLERLRHGTFVYLRHADDGHAGFRFISLAGSFQAIGEALYWCAPRLPADERNPIPDVGAGENQGDSE